MPRLRAKFYQCQNHSINFRDTTWSPKGPTVHIFLAPFELMDHERNLFNGSADRPHSKNVRGDRRARYVNAFKSWREQTSSEKTNEKLDC